MKKQVALIVLTLVLSLILCACGQKQTAGDWQQQYDLGIKLLSEGKYEEAIIAFTAAIKIDPKRAPAYIGRGDAYVQLDEQLDLAQADYEKAIELDEGIAEGYLGLADVYIRRGDYAKALEIISQGLEKTGDEKLAAKKAELEKGNIVDSSSQERRMSAYDANGTLIYYHEFTYEKGRRSGVTSYNASGGITGHVDLTNNEEDYIIFSDGEVSVGDEGAGNVIYEHDEKGRVIQESQYSSDGELEEYILFEYNSDGRTERNSGYSPDGSLKWYYTYQYDDNGNKIGYTHYDGAGNIVERTEYSR
ncbi:MAG: tetratricopeptide repeat protein [Firmicutes bacterium]|nr:tetratricopeptide repeat protein [Bacillota bacterium]